MNAASDIISSKKGLTSNNTNTFAFFDNPGAIYLLIKFVWVDVVRIGEGQSLKTPHLREFPEKVGET